MKISVVLFQDRLGYNFEIFISNSHEWAAVFIYSRVHIRLLSFGKFLRMTKDIFLRKQHSDNNNEAWSSSCINNKTADNLNLPAEPSAEHVSEIKRPTHI